MKVRIVGNSLLANDGLSGAVHAAASKSSMQRACAAALVRRGESLIRNPGRSNDDKAALDVIKRLGAQITTTDKYLKIKSYGVQAKSDTVSCGESGLGIRMFTPIIALSENEITVNGEGSLLTRPMDFFDEVLPKLDVTISSNDGKLPIRIQGPLSPKNIEIDGSLSSQFLTGLLFAYAALDAKDVSIRVTNLKSKPYIDLTLQVMEQFLLKVPENRNYEEFYFEDTPVATTSDFVDYTVEGDWSGGAFLLVAGTIAGNMKVCGLDIASTQADKKIIRALEDCGSQFSMSDHEILFPRRDDRTVSLHPFVFDATDSPDLFPPLAALAAYCNGITKIDGVFRLTHKESNRALTIQQELGKMGVKIDLHGNTMLIAGDNKVRGAVVSSRHDHRIAMMCAVAALKAEGETTIDDADAINKSYPDFYRHLQSIGADLKIDD
ncbi:MAG TPA: 3-phosphoshikimate 1-carboxyvinyltransferase [Parafilimonas sp.]|nr:3-phosphoshikimate 1-carboxyvinyltransferase [Parafilimonas sp.]